ncbi:hypothetical protein [Streptomyces buecherae]|uniref:hypothetical protein n=1 Tax=Streptomyces buecherae TaxID=2763006 RepID=UPI003647DAD4
MVNGISDDDVVGVLTAQIEAHLGVGLRQVKAALAAAPPAAAPAARSLVRWHSLLVDSQRALDRAEDALLAELERQPGELDDPTMELAQRVNAAVTVRDGRAMVVRWLLDPNAPGKRGPAAERLARLRPRSEPAVPTSAPHQPGASPAALAAQVRRSAR